jgi:hypothetical protein
MTINTSAPQASVFAVTNPATGEIIQHVSSLSFKKQLTLYLHGGLKQVRSELLFCVIGLI